MPLAGHDEGPRLGVYVAFHAMCVLSMGVAAWLSLLSLCQAWFLRAKLNLVMQSYVRLMAVEALLAAAYCFSSLIGLADLAVFKGGSPGWCRASAFVTFWLFMGQSAGVVLVSQATRYVVHSNYNEDPLTSRPNLWMGGALTVGALLASLLSWLGVLGNNTGRLFCLGGDDGDGAQRSRRQGQGLAVSPPGTIGVTMALTAAVVILNCWRGVRDLKRLTGSSSSTATTSTTTAAASRGGPGGPELGNTTGGVMTPRANSSFQSPAQAAAAVRILITFISEVLSVLLTYLVSSGCLLVLLLTRTSHHPSSSSKRELLLAELLAAALGVAVRLEPFVNSLVFFSAVKRLRVRALRVTAVPDRALVLQQLKSSHEPSELFSVASGAGLGHSTGGEASLSWAESGLEGGGGGGGEYGDEYGGSDGGGAMGVEAGLPRAYVSGLLERPLHAGLGVGGNNAEEGGEEPAMGDEEAADWGAPPGGSSSKKKKAGGHRWGDRSSKRRAGGGGASSSSSPLPSVPDEEAAAEDDEDAEREGQQQQMSRRQRRQQKKLEQQQQQQQTAGGSSWRTTGGQLLLPPVRGAGGRPLAVVEGAGGGDALTAPVSLEALLRDPLSHLRRLKASWHEVAGLGGPGGGGWLDRLSEVSERSTSALMGGHGGQGQSDRFSGMWSRDASSSSTADRSAAGPLQRSSSRNFSPSSSHNNAAAFSSARVLFRSRSGSPSSSSDNGPLGGAGGRDASNGGGSSSSSPRGGPLWSSMTEEERDLMALRGGQQQQEEE